MNNTLDIEINGTPCVLFFGYATFSELAKQWNVPGFKGVTEKLASFGNLTDDISFPQFEIIGDVVAAGLVSNPATQPEFKRDEIMDSLISDVAVVAEVVMKLVTVLNKPKTPDVKPGKLKVIKGK